MFVLSGIAGVLGSKLGNALSEKGDIVDQVI